MGGERLCDVTEYEGTWLALLAWNAPAYHSKERDDELLRAETLPPECDHSWVD